MKKNIILLFSFMSVLALVSFHFYQQKVSDELRYTDEIFFKHSKAYSSTIQDLTNRVALVFINQIQRPEIIDIISQANKTSDKAELSLLRQKLEQNVQTLYKTLQLDSISNLHFHLPGAISFYRAHKPSKFGDSLVQARPSIVKLNQTREYIAGYESGKFLNAYRNIIPLFDQTEFIGSVEVSYTERKMVQELEQATQNKYDFLVDRSIFKNDVLTSEKFKYTSSLLYPEFVMKHENLLSSKQHMSFPYQALVTQLRKQVSLEKLKQFKSFSEVVYLDDTFIVSWLPVKNIAGDQVAYVVSYEKDSGKIAEIRAEFWFNLVISTLLLGGLFYFIKYQQRKNESLELEKKYFDLVFNSQTDYVVLTRGLFISDANRALLDFLEFDTLQDFRKVHDCICDYFEVIDKPDYIYKDKDGQNWVDTVQNNPDIDYKAQIKQGGKTYTVSVAATPIHFDKEKRSIVVMSDISKLLDIQQNLEEAVQEKTSALQKYVDLVDENVIISSTDKDGRITFASHAFQEISGYRQEELIGKKHNIVRHPEMEAQLYKDLWRTISNGETWQGEIRNRKKGGGDYWVDARIYPDYNELGEIMGYTAIRMDITYRKELEAILNAKGSAL